MTNNLAYLLNPMSYKKFPLTTQMKHCTRIYINYLHDW